MTYIAEKVGHSLSSNGTGWDYVDIVFVSCCLPVVFGVDVHFDKIGIDDPVLLIIGRLADFVLSLKRDIGTLVWFGRPALATIDFVKGDYKGDVFLSEHFDGFFGLVFEGVHEVDDDYGQIAEGGAS